MKKTQKILMALYAGFLLAATLLYIGGEFLHWDMAIWADATKGTTFICSTLMILFTLALLPLALRLFKFKRIQAALVDQKAPALLQWGSLRLIIMGILLVVNTFLYYAFAFESSYGYLAVITLLCMPFVIPTMRRCEAETTQPTPPTPPEEEETEESPSPSEEDSVEVSPSDEDSVGDVPSQEDSNAASPSATLEETK